MDWQLGQGLIEGGHPEAYAGYAGNPASTGILMQLSNISLNWKLSSLVYALPFGGGFLGLIVQHIVGCNIREHGWCLAVPIISVVIGMAVGGLVSWSLQSRGH